MVRTIVQGEHGTVHEHLRPFLGPFLIHGPHVVGTGSGVSLAVGYSSDDAVP
jgi:hypothetical protein